MKWSLEGAKIFSTCSKAQYMAIVVDSNRRILGTGYNGTPSGMQHCNDNGCPRVANNAPSGSPYDYGLGLCFAIHAEANALLHSDRSARVGGTIYVGGLPCFGCAKLIAGSGLARLVYLGNEADREDHTQSIEVLSKSGIKIERLDQKLIKE